MKFDNRILLIPLGVMIILLMAASNSTLDCSHITYPTDVEKTIAIMKYCTHAEKEVP